MLPFIIKSQNVVHIVYIFFSHIFLKIHFNEDFTHFYFTKSVCTVTDGLPVDKSKGQSSVLTLFELPATFEIIDTYFLFLEPLPLLDFQDIGSPDYLHYTSPFF